MAHVSADDLFRLMQSKFAMDDELAKRVRSMCEAMIEFADEAVKAEREACAVLADNHAIGDRDRSASVQTSTATEIAALIRRRS